MFSTCVVKPDGHREDDRLGISHSVTHRCSSAMAHVQGLRRARKGGRGEGGWNGDGGWDEEQEVVSERIMGRMHARTERREKVKKSFKPRRKKSETSSGATWCL